MRAPLAPPRLSLPRKLAAEAQAVVTSWEMDRPQAADDTPVLVFDEVDAGIGGGVARAVGAKLAALAQGRQVLCVTHSAQLAAHADAHFLVTKEATPDGRTRSDVTQLDRAARVAELSRMLSGSTDSDVAARHADELLTTVHAR
jgi:DNA repair protein RecN (Recombination protein N)